MAKKLVRLFPEHSTYVEPFAGGAAVFFRKPLVKRNVIGDYDKWLIDFYKKVRDGGLSKCSIGLKKSRTAFDAAKKRQKSACDKMMVSHLSFHGDRIGYIGDSLKSRSKYTNRTILRRHKDYKKKLRQSYVRLSDFASTMRKFDGPDTLHFLDPPWVMDYSDRYYHGGKKAVGRIGKGRKYKATGFDPNRIKKVADSMKGYVFIITNNDPNMKRLFCKAKGWKCGYVTATVNKWRKDGSRGVFKEKQLIMKKDFGAVTRKQRKPKSKRR